MICPYCGNEMVKGYIQHSGNGLRTTWDTRVHALSVNGSEIEFPCTLFHPEVEAHYCRGCKKMVIDLNDIQNKAAEG